MYQGNILDVAGRQVLTTEVTYHVNGERVDKETYEKAIADIEDTYLDNIRDMLLGYSEVMDRVNEFYKLLW